MKLVKLELKIELWNYVLKWKNTGKQYSSKLFFGFIRGICLILEVNKNSCIKIFLLYRQPTATNEICTDVLKMCISHVQISSSESHTSEWQCRHLCVRFTRSLKSCSNWRAVTPAPFSTSRQVGSFLIKGSTKSVSAEHNIHKWYCTTIYSGLHLVFSVLRNI